MNLPSGKLETDYIGNTRQFWATHVLTFADHSGAPVEVPAYFMSDGLSIPRIFHALFSKSPRFIYAGILHDYSYRKDFPHPMTQKQCDKLLKHYLKLYGVGIIKRNAIYSGVRIGGWLSFRKHNSAYYAPRL